MVLAVLLSLPLSIGVSRFLPVAVEPLTTVAASVERVDPLAVPLQAELVQQRVAARAVLSPARDATGRHPLRVASALAAMLAVLLVIAARRDPSCHGDPASTHLLLLASTSARRGPPVVA